MKGNLTVLNTNKQTNPTFKDIITKLLNTLDEEQGQLKLYSGLIVIDTDQGIGLFNLTQNELTSLVGLLEVGKTILIEQMADLDSEF